MAGLPQKEEATSRDLTWRLAKESEVWFCHCGKWQITMDDPATIFVTVQLLFCLFFIRPKCIVPRALFSFLCVYFHFYFQHVLVQLNYACLTFICAWRGGDSLESLCKYIHFLSSDISLFSLQTSRTRRKTTIRRPFVPHDFVGQSLSFARAVWRLGKKENFLIFPFSRWIVC